MNKTSTKTKFIKKISMTDTLRAMPIGSEISIHQKDVTYNTVKSAIRILQLKTNMRFTLSNKGGLISKIKREDDRPES